MIDYAEWIHDGRPCLLVRYNGHWLVVPDEQKAFLVDRNILHVMPADDVPLPPVTIQVDDRTVTLTSHVQDPELLDLWKQMTTALQTGRWTPRIILSSPDIDPPQVPTTRSSYRSMWQVDFQPAD